MAKESVMSRLGSHRSGEIEKSRIDWRAYNLISPTDDQSAFDLTLLEAVRRPPVMFE